MFSTANPTAVLLREPAGASAALRDEPGIMLMFG